MSKRKENTRALDEGAAKAEPVVDLTHDPNPINYETQRQDTRPDDHSNKGSVYESFKQALRPGDAKMQDQWSKEHGSGGLMSSLKPSDEPSSSTESSNKSSGLLDKLGLGHVNSNTAHTHPDLKSETDQRDPRHYKHDKFPMPETRSNWVHEDADAAPRVSTFDSQGNIGHQFSSEGVIGGTADKVGGPFTKDGVVGQQFTDKGAVGGKVQDILGHGDVTRKGK